MGVGQLSESDAVDALRLPFYSSSHPTGSHGWRNQFDLGNPDIDDTAEVAKVSMWLTWGKLRTWLRTLSIWAMYRGSVTVRVSLSKTRVMEDLV